MTFNPTRALTAFATWSEGMCVPTPLELSCADPGAPCRLPNSFVSDPPLAPIVARTLELGARGGPDARVAWSAAAYRTELSADLAFVSSGGSGATSGYFRNVGGTRRQGFELAATARRARGALTLGYSYLDATYRAGFSSPSPANSSADAAGDIAIRRGDRLPGIPRHTLKAHIELAAGSHFAGGLAVRYSSPVFARGDENNRDRNGPVPGFVTVACDLRYAAGATLEIYARVDNLFDRRYANVGVHGRNVFTGPGAASTAPTRAPSSSAASARRAAPGSAFATGRLEPASRLRRPAVPAGSTGSRAAGP